MKQLLPFMLISITFITSLCSISEGLAQTYEYEAKLIQIYRGDSFFVDLYLRAMQSPGLRLGTSTFFIDYNQDALLFIGKIAKYDGLWDEGNVSAPGSYMDCWSQKHITEPRCSFNIERSLAAPQDGGVSIPDDFSLMGRIGFLVLDADLERNIRWNPFITAAYEWTGSVDFTSLISFIVDPIVVPVELVDFQATSIDGVVELTWETGSETDNLGFLIYRAEEDQKYIPINNNKFIKGSGTTEKSSSYRWVDKEVEVGEKYNYRLVDIAYSGSMTFHDPVQVAILPPNEYKLEQNYPNPFNPTTNIDFKLKEGGNVDISIFNIKGQLVRKLAQKRFAPGKHTIVWDGLNDQGLSLPSGIYWCRMNVNTFQQIIKLHLVK